MADPRFTEITYPGGASDDFIEVSVDAGMDVSGVQIATYHPSGNIRSTNGIGSLCDAVFGQDIYTLGTDVHKNGAVALVMEGGVLDFVSFERVVTAYAGPAAGMISKKTGSSQGDPEPMAQPRTTGNWVTELESEGSVPCFLAGTKIATRRGEIAVQDLRPGDHVMVRDGGFAPIRWIGSYTANARGLGFDKAAPIKIPRGAMGKGQPSRDLYLSPNHRIWMRDASFEMLFETREVLVPAKQLIGWNGITQVSYVPEPEYFHFLCDAHQIVLSDGLLTESFHPDEVTLDQFEHEARDELLRMFPDLMQVATGGRTARRCLKGYETQLAMQAKSVA